MNLKRSVDEQVKRLYYLTEVVKKLVPIREFTNNSRTNQVLIEVLNEYNVVAEKSRELLFEYLQEERTKGNYPLEYIRIYKKLGAKEYV